MNEDEQIGKLKAKIKKLEKQTEAAETWRDDVRELDDFTHAEMIAIFKSLHKQAMAYVEYLAENGYPPKDSRAYIFEAVITSCLGEDVWDLIGSLDI